jgi:hypothetical protein
MLVESDDRGRDEKSDKNKIDTEVFRAGHLVKNEDSRRTAKDARQHGMQLVISGEWEEADTQSLRFVKHSEESLFFANSNRILIQRAV